MEHNLKNLTDSQLFPHNNRKSSFDLVNLLNVCRLLSSNPNTVRYRGAKLLIPSIFSILASISTSLRSLRFRTFYSSLKMIDINWRRWEFIMQRSSKLIVRTTPTRLKVFILKSKSSMRKSLLITIILLWSIFRRILPSYFMKSRFLLSTCEDCCW